MKLFKIRRRGREKIQDVPIEVDSPEEVDRHMESALREGQEAFATDDSGTVVASVQRDAEGRLSKWVREER